MTRIVVLCLVFALGGCGGFGLFGKGNERLQPIPRDAKRERSVSPAAAIQLINAHRAQRGRPPLTVDPKLNSIAADTARELARRNQVRTEMHSADGLARRLDAARYPASRAAENLAGGYPTLAMTVDGWKGSRTHNTNLLNADMTHAGIGLAVKDEGAIRSFWVLLLARPAG